VLSVRRVRIPFCRQERDLRETRTDNYSSLSGQSPTHFSSLLTTLFESIALIISQHQPVVEKYYGSGKMLSVASSLMVETDRLGLRVIANWEEERRIRSRVLEISQHRFQGIAGLKKIQTSKPNVSPMLNQGGFDSPTPQQATLETSQIDPKETDAVLTELNMMSGRWELLRRFLYGTLGVSPHNLSALLHSFADKNLRRLAG